MNRSAALISLAAIGGALCLFAFVSRPADAELIPQAMPRRVSVSAEQGPADLVLMNGKIYTVDTQHPWAYAIAVRVESILDIADSAADVKSFIGPNTQVVDLHGQCAMPGFNDAHVHLAGAGYARLEVDLDGVTSLAQFQQRIRDRLKDFKPGEWMNGRGWDHTLWPEKKFP